MNKFYITTPIYYVNDKPHIGHAYTTIAGDVLARYHRLKGEDVFFLTGTDEHGDKVARSAEAKGESPLKFCDENSAKFQLAWDVLDITNNDFIRTTEERHKKTVKVLFEKLREARTPLGNAVIYEGEYDGLYCIGCEKYITEKELDNGKCPDHRKEPEAIKEKNWFFRLSDYGELLKKKIESDEVYIFPQERKNEVLSFINQGLDDVAISRPSVKWGLPIPWDKEQTIYVWIEALMNYLSAVFTSHSETVLNNPHPNPPQGEGERIPPPLEGVRGRVGEKILPRNYNNFSINSENEKGKKLWPADVHLMAKDIIKFHAIIWPAILLALGLELPKNIGVHGFFTIDGKKMSKSLGNVLDPIELAQKYGVDSLRYYLLREAPFGNDGNISVARFKERYVADLQNGLGNLVSRVFTLAGKEQFLPLDFQVKNKESVGSEIQAKVRQVWETYEISLENFQFSEVLASIWKLISFCDGYITETKPWKLVENEQEEFVKIIYNLLETIRHIAWQIQPFMPTTSEVIIKRLFVDEENEKKEFAKNFKGIKKWGGLQVEEIRVERGGALFPKLDY